MHLKPCLFALLLTLPGIVHASQTELARMGWLAGCWQIVDAEPGSGEIWMRAAGGAMLGISRVVKDGKTVHFEWMRLLDDSKGKLQFIAQPSGQPETAFELSDLAPSHAAFINPMHDFPQRIVYRHLDDDTAEAYIEGRNKGVQQRVTFPLRREQCEQMKP